MSVCTGVDCAGAPAWPWVRIACQETNYVLRALQHQLQISGVGDRVHYCSDMDVECFTKTCVLKAWSFFVVGTKRVEINQIMAYAGVIFGRCLNWTGSSRWRPLE